jgi:dTDP-4-amino-4,6-dideoxygalactose transaminase
VDSEVNNPCLTVDKIKEISLSSYDTVVVVCPLSIIPDLKSISDFCRENNKKLIVDGAATFGTTNDNSIFNYGDVFCMSFHATKTLSVGECGCTMANEELSDKIKKYITFGFDDSRTPVMVGMNAKVSEYTCAVLLDLLSTIDSVLMVKGANSYYYNKRLKEKVLIVDPRVQRRCTHLL